VSARELFDSVAEVLIQAECCVFDRFVVSKAARERPLRFDAVGSTLRSRQLAVSTPAAAVTPSSSSREQQQQQQQQQLEQQQEQAKRIAQLEKANGDLVKFQDEARSLYALATAHEAERSQLRRSLDAQTHAAENAERALAAANVRANATNCRAERKTRRRRRPRRRAQRVASHSVG
jgi:TolA-binding protein